LDHAITLTRGLRCQLVVLCSRRCRPEDVLELLDQRAFTRAIVTEVPANHRYSAMEFGTSTDPDIRGACADRDSDLSTKRNIGLLLARLLGWQRIFFLDDDIRAIQPHRLRETVCLLDTYAAAGMSVSHFPDNSVVCHARRETGRFQDVFVSGSVLAVDCSRPSGFFPDIYNEDWLFLYDQVAAGSVGFAGRWAQQLRYDPFADPERAAREEFGDLLAEGLYAALHSRQRKRVEHVSYWEDFKAARQQFLEAILTRSERSDVETHDLDKAVKAAKEQLEQIQPRLCRDYLRLWGADLVGWTRILRDLPLIESSAAALAYLGLTQLPLAGASAAREVAAR
jgi:hypothetical protein